MGKPVLPFYQPPVTGAGVGDATHRCEITDFHDPVRCGDMERPTEACELDKRLSVTRNETPTDATKKETIDCVKSRNEQIAQEATDQFCDWLLRMIPKPIREETKIKAHQVFLSAIERAKNE